MANESKLFPSLEGILFPERPDQAFVDDSEKQKRSIEEIEWEFENNRRKKFNEMTRQLARLPINQFKTEASNIIQRAMDTGIVRKDSDLTTLKSILTDRDVPNLGPWRNEVSPLIDKLRWKLRVQTTFRRLLGRK